MIRCTSLQERLADEGVALIDHDADIRQHVNKALAESGLEIDFQTPFEGCDALETAPDSKLVRELEQLSGAPAEAVAFATEGPYLASLGMDVVIMGPGDIATAHQPGEHLRQDRIAPTINILEALIRRFCR